MNCIQIPEKHDAKGFLLLAKSGMPVVCLADNIYGVSPDQIRTLKRKRIPFKQSRTNRGLLTG
jgi:hypothetical protein